MTSSPLFSVPFLRSVGVAPRLGLTPPAGLTVEWLGGPCWKIQKSPPWSSIPDRPWDWNSYIHLHDLNSQYCFGNYSIHGWYVYDQLWSMIYETLNEHITWNGGYKVPRGSLVFWKMVFQGTPCSVHPFSSSMCPCDVFVQSVLFSQRDRFHEQNLVLNSPWVSMDVTSNKNAMTW